MVLDGMVQSGSTCLRRMAEGDEATEIRFGRFLRNELVTTRELQQAQTYAIGVHAIRQQSGGAVLADMVDAWMFGELTELREFDNRIRAVTAEQMRELAVRYFDDERRVEGIIRGVGKTV